MKIKVIFWKGKSFMLEVKPTDTVRQVKEKIQKKVGIPADQQIATLCRMELKDDKMLLEYSLHKTLAAIDNNCFQKPNGAFSRSDGGFAIPPAKSPAAPPHPPAQLGMAQTHDPNYQTLAGIGGDVFKK
ncbi:hypothetical protein M3Y96_00444600 [Aphelenchoides besseyi]|nr:hypothetical protein M3Y96_00444600 [Aphelenchoides besseyi]